MYMENVCLMCERDGRYTDWYALLPREAAEIQNEIANLELTLEGLESQDETMQSLIENRHLLCGMCRQLMEDIEDQSNRRDLEERINRQIFILGEQLSKRVPGQL